MPARSPSKPLRVTVVADNRETIDGLHGYLTDAGIASHTTRLLGDVRQVPASTSALVIFPDEFPVAEVVSSLSALRATRPRLLIVVVTGAPQRLRPALAPDGASRLPVVLPKPAFGWSILDAVRESQAASSLPKER